ncbi:MAG: Phd YefM protein [Mucilaginibacter sp.]|nr:Phd YefM protein [Mucilaginibacter sp.]
MRSISVSEFKNSFSEIIKQVKAGEEFAITEDNKSEAIGYFVKQISKPEKRKLGLLEGNATFTFGSNFEMTEDEFLNLS